MGELREQSLYEETYMSDSEYCTMQEIAKLVGSTSHQIGRRLKRLGLRLDNGEPSPKAHQLGLSRKRPVYGREQFSVWMWHLKKTLPILEETEVSEKPHGVDGVIAARARNGIPEGRSTIH